MELKEKIDAAADCVRTQSDLQPEVAIILGTGLGGVTEDLKNTTEIPYEQIPNMPRSAVTSHKGDLVLGTLSGKPVMVMSGRFHYYEGYSMQEVTFPVRLAKALGAHTLVVSNAAGGMNPFYKSGDIMLIADQINLMGDNPLIGPNDDELGDRFPDMIEPYTNALIELAEKIALEQGQPLRKGVYLAVSGPMLETRAEYRYMRQIGGDAVGMSTVPEVIVAVHAGMNVLGFSVITDECLPDALKPISVPEIIAVANSRNDDRCALVLGLIESL